jgi:hypothetical protein
MRPGRDSDWCNRKRLLSRVKKMRTMILMKIATTQKRKRRSSPYSSLMKRKSSSR